MVRFKVGVSNSVQNIQFFLKDIPTLTLSTPLAAPTLILTIKWILSGSLSHF
jgi:hypothetical protein